MFVVETFSHESFIVRLMLYLFFPLTAKENGRFKTMCCIPVFLIFIFVIACIIAGIVLLCVNGVHDFSETKYTAENSVLIGIAIIVGVALIGNCYTWARIIVNIIISPRRRVQMIANKVDSISGMETVIQVSHDAD